MRHLVRAYVLLVILLVLACAAELYVGHVGLSDATLRAQVLHLRLLRMASAFLAGAALAVGGVAVQGLFRNPLASPDILGTTSGANLGGQIAILGLYLIAGKESAAYLPTELVLAFGCLAGALLALMVVVAFLRLGGDLVTVLLTGFVLSSFFLSIGSFVISMSQQSWALGRAMVNWSLGGLSGVGITQISFSLPLVVISIVALFFWHRPLDLLLSGEDEAQSLGVNVKRTRNWIIIWVGLLTGAAVALAGGVAFVGLVVPHMLRPFFGYEHKRLIPAAAIAGGAYLILCDALSRAMPSASELPLGVLTSFIGAPVFFMVLIRVRRGQHV